jgi:hypothetical protein
LGFDKLTPNGYGITREIKSARRDRVADGFE